MEKKKKADMEQEETDQTESAFPPRSLSVPAKIIETCIHVFTIFGPRGAQSSDPLQ